MAIVRVRLPAAGAGTAAGRLRWVGRESERLRQWLTIDARRPAAWLGGTVVPSLCSGVGSRWNRPSQGRPEVAADGDP